MDAIYAVVIEGLAEAKDRVALDDELEEPVSITDPDSDREARRALAAQYGVGKKVT